MAQNVPFVLSRIHYDTFCAAVTPEGDALLTNILKKHAAEGTEELGQAQFAQILQGILQDLADSLALKPIVIIQDIKVINGSQLRKVWMILIGCYDWKYLCTLFG